MPFEQIVSPNLADAAASQIRDLIASDVLRPGDQLPGERDLSAQMGISRTSLRAGLQTLMAEGLLVSRHGSGLFVAKALGRRMIDPLTTLIESTPSAIADYLTFRRMLESESAAIVAERATAAERAHIAQIHDAMQDAYEACDQELEMRLDTEFHMAIVDATGNVVSIQIARSLHDLMQQTVRRNHAMVYGEGDGREALSTQHHAINAAIQAGDPEASRAAMQAHLTFFADQISRHADAAHRREIVEKRQQWADIKDG